MEEDGDAMGKRRGHRLQMPPSRRRVTLAGLRSPSQGTVQLAPSQLVGTRDKLELTETLRAKLRLVQLCV